MAIKVNGTTVINDSRQLQNVASVDATTVAALGAAGVGGGAPLPPEWDPTVTPDVTFSSSGTWNKPGGLADDVWVVFYAVGGGAKGLGGFYCPGGGGGSATIAAGLAGELPSSVTITVAAPGTLANNVGNSTVMSISGKSIYALGGVLSSNVTADPQEGIVVMPPPANPFGYYPSLTDVRGGPGSPRSSSLLIANTIYGANGGGGGAISSAYGGNQGGTSTYAGGGGTGYDDQNGAAGSAPGGGGGGSYNYGGGDGAAGSVRIYYLD